MAKRISDIKQFWCVTRIKRAWKHGGDDDNGYDDHEDADDKYLQMHCSSDNNILCAVLNYMLYSPREPKNHSAGQEIPRM